MKRVLVVHHTLEPPGGGSAVCAWALEALRTRYAVSVLTWGPADVGRVNRAFGTSLVRAEYRWHTVPWVARAFVASMPLPLALLTSHVLFRSARTLHDAGRFDAVLSTINEIDIGTRAIQYVHYPWLAFPRPPVDYRWYHLTPLVLLYRRLSVAISSARMESTRENRTLVNSDWTGRVFERSYRARSTTVYPPVPGGFPEVDFENRSPVLAVVGRIAPEKRVDAVVDIVAAVRDRGHRVGLRIIGHVDDAAYAARVRERAAPHRDWVSFHIDLARDELVALLADCRYGIHAMAEEHFGIAPAELQRAGCITFVPAGGGPPEIVDHDERLVFASDDEAVDKIDRVLSDPGLQSSLLRDVRARRDRFSETRFMRELLAEVDAFVGTAPG